MRARLATLSILLALAACKKDGATTVEKPTPDRLVHLDIYDEAGLDPLPKARWATEVALALIEQEVPHLAAVHLERATAHAAAIGSPADRTACLERIAYARARAGSHEIARTISERLKSPEARAATMARVVIGTADRGEPEMAAKLYDALSAPDDRAALAVVRAWIHAGKLDAAGRAAERTRGRPIHGEALGEVAVANAKRRRLRLAEQALDQIDNPHWRGAAQAAIVEARYRKRRRAAERLAKTIDSPWMATRAYGRLTVLASRRGRHRAARRYFSRAETIVEGINDPILRSSATVELVRTHVELRRTKLAQELASSIPDSSTRGSALLEILKAHLDRDDLEAAQGALVAVLDNPLYADEALERLAAATEAHAEVTKLARQIRAPNAKIRALANYAARHRETPIDTNGLNEISALIR